MKTLLTTLSLIVGISGFSQDTAKLDTIGFYMTVQNPLNLEVIDVYEARLIRRIEGQKVTATLMQYFNENWIVYEAKEENIYITFKQKK